MSGIEGGGRHGPTDRRQDDSGAGLSARADSGFAGRDRTLGRDAGRDRLSPSAAAALAERSAALARRIGEENLRGTGETGERRGEDAPVSDQGRGTLLASAWMPAPEAAAGEAPPPAPPAPSRTEVLAARAAERIAAAVDAEIASLPGAPIGFRLDLGGLDLPFASVMINLTRTDVDVTILVDPAAAGSAAGAVPAGVADELARALAARLKGRRISVLAAGDRREGGGTPFGMIRSILEGEA